MEEADTLLAFWLGTALESDDGLTAATLRWFVGSAALDRQIEERFANLPDRARAGELREWNEQPRSCLALILALDQLPRNLYRDRGEAFAYDAHARRAAETAIRRGFDTALHPIEAAFVYMPFEHSESLADQERSVSLFAALRERAASGQRTCFDGFLDYADQHREVIRRFGRFPHRNEALGRPSTAEESAYLEAGGETFGSAGPEDSAG